MPSLEMQQLDGPTSPKATAAAVNTETAPQRKSSRADARSSGSVSFAVEDSASSLNRAPATMLHGNNNINSANNNGKSVRTNGFKPLYSTDKQPSTTTTTRRPSSSRTSPTDDDGQQPRASSSSNAPLTANGDNRGLAVVSPARFFAGFVNNVRQGMNWAIRSRQRRAIGTMPGTPFNPVTPNPNNTAPKIAGTPAGGAANKKASVAVSNAGGDAHEELLSAAYFRRVIGESWVLDTQERRYIRYLAVVALAVLYNYIFIVLRTVFKEAQNDYKPIWYVLDALADLVYIFDMFVRIITGYLDKGLLVRDVDKLWSRYTHSLQLKIDIISILPTDLLYFVIGTNAPAPGVRCNRLLRLPRMLEFANEFETRSRVPNVVRICVLVFYILLIMHWNACMYWVMCLLIGLNATRWTYPGEGSYVSVKDEHTGHEKLQSYWIGYDWPRDAYKDPLNRKYLYSLWWSMMTLTTIGEIPQPEIDIEYVYQSICFLSAVLIFATIVGQVGSMITNINSSKSEFQAKVDGIKRYMEVRNVGKRLQQRIIHWFDYLWTNKQSPDEDLVLDDLPDKLRAEISVHVHYDTIKKVPIFQGADPGLLTELVQKLKLQVFSPGDYVCRKGDIGREMYIVKRGKLSVVSDDAKTVFATLSDGAVFGELAILDIPGNKIGNRRTANVRSAGYTDLFVLSKAHLFEALTEYQDVKQQIMERGIQILRKDNLIDEEKLRDAGKVKMTKDMRVERAETDLDNVRKRMQRFEQDLRRYIHEMEEKIGELDDTLRPPARHVRQKTMLQLPVVAPAAAKEEVNQQLTVAAPLVVEKTADSSLETAL